MSILHGKKILFGVTGGIAAYKTAHLVRLFVKAGAEVQVLMTASAKDFITPLTLATLSKREVFSELINTETENPTWNNHVDFSLWADFFIVAPATANTLAKMANGVCDNLVLATFLSCKCPVYVAPAMDLDMYQHPTTKSNLDKLQQNGINIIPAESGELASGLQGEGRMAEPENIVLFLENHLQKQAPLFGKKVLITAGPTYEAIDPVRFIGNHASGLMGFQLAEQAASLGAKVTLVSGPSYLNVQNPLIKKIKVVSAADMLQEVLNHFDTSDIVIMAAAVADYKPKHAASQKVKKSEANWVLELEKTTDILFTLGQQKKHQLLVGFALETNNEIEHANQKLTKKNLDFIVLNSLNDAGAGFGVSTNKITLMDKFGRVEEGVLKPKSEVAFDILQKAISMMA
ncbi:MAG: bifunctional phosphopantothenoylcysteine decarboxylase/phosphopantothenate--cysteine ligase CoaBC [Flavobacteriales bacterium]|nr:bifunctional phosphopantothenoylcysteine decarboxylase/phosphopantothenate--cysteine ligase CoaBC [Flavobacteriales bacterium]